MRILLYYDRNFNLRVLWIGRLRYGAIPANWSSRQIVVIDQMTLDEKAFQERSLPAGKREALI